MIFIKALIFIHGFSSDKDDFKSIYQRVKDEYDFVSLENLPGHSNKDLKGFNCVDTIIYVKELCKEVFSKYDIVDIVGYSMGGAITTMLSTEFDFRKIVLVSPANKYMGLGNTYKQIPFYFKSLVNKNEDDVYKQERILNETKHALSLFPANYKKFNHKALINFTQVIDYCNTKLIDSNKKIQNVSIIYGLLDQIIPKKSITFLNKHSDSVKYFEIEYANHFLLISDYTEYVSNIIEDELIELTLEKIMKQKRFCLLGDTENIDKPANKIKNKLIENNYEYTEDIDSEFDVLNLCMNPQKSLELIRGSKLKFRYVLIQPGAESEELYKYFNAKQIKYINGCTLKGLELTK